MSKPIFCERINFDGKSDPSGLIFVDPKNATITDLSGVRILRCGVDTVRQLYRGVLRTGYSRLFEKPGAIVQLGGYSWHSGRVSRDSGYQYKLQNADLGLVLLLKNFNVRDDQHGPHLKIEVSPHHIDAISPHNLQARLDTIAGHLLDEIELNQCAVHLALDVQGWTPPADLVARMHCRARRTMDISGIDEIDWHSKASVYGRGESWLFGSPSGIQLSIYNKTLQARATDKLDYWESVWRRRNAPGLAADPENYDPATDVYRIELRFHHSVIAQFAAGSVDLETEQTLSTCDFSGLSPHLLGLWRYGLNAFRLLARPGVFDPFWTLIQQDVQIDLPCDSAIEGMEYKRYYKTSRGFSGKNVELFLGNFVSLLARERVGATRAFQALQEWDCWPVIRDHYHDKGKTDQDIYRHIRDLLQERHIRWGRAV